MANYVISQMELPNGDICEIKDSAARSEIITIRNSLASIETKRVFGPGTDLIIPDTKKEYISFCTLNGKSIQDGTPTGTAPVAIQSAGDGNSVVLISRSNNLVEFKNKGLSVTSRGVTMSSVGDGRYILNGTATAASYITINPPSTPSNILTAATLFTLNEGTTYYFSGNIQLMYTYFDNGTETTGNQYFGTSSDEENPYVSSPRIYTPTTTLYVKQVRAYLYSGKSYNQSVKYEPYVGETQLTKFEPYDNTVITLPLTDNLYGVPVSGFGNYMDGNDQQWITDTIDLESDIYIKRVIKIVLDGSNTPTNVSTNSGYTYFMYATGSSYDFNSGIGGLCSHAVFGAAQSGRTASEFYTPLTSTKSVRFTLPSSTVGTSASAVKSWLTSNNITLLLPLAEPIITNLTDAQRLALHSLHSCKGTTILTSTNNIKPGIQVKVSMEEE